MKGKRPATVAERVWKALTEPGVSVGRRAWRYLPNAQKAECLAAIERAIGEPGRCPRPLCRKHRRNDDALLVREHTCLDCLMDESAKQALEEDERLPDDGSACSERTCGNCGRCC